MNILYILLFSCSLTFATVFSQSCNSSKCNSCEDCRVNPNGEAKCVLKDYCCPIKPIRNCPKIKRTSCSKRPIFKCRENSDCGSKFRVCCDDGCGGKTCTISSGVSAPAAASTCIINPCQNGKSICPGSSFCVPQNCPGGCEPVFYDDNFDRICGKCGNERCLINEKCVEQKVQCFAAPCSPLMACIVHEQKCGDSICQPDETCVEQQPQCFRAPCPSFKFCQKKDLCGTVTCANDEICVEEQVQCIRAPCPPIKSCKKNSVSDHVCPAREPDDQEFCSRVDVRNECSNDFDCSFGRKCCTGVCGSMQCIEGKQNNPNTGTCPPIPPTRPEYCQTVRVGILCKSDDECKQGDKCCPGVCGGTSCKKSTEPPPLNCPAPPPFDTDFCSRALIIAGCKTTGDCTNGDVCCPGTCNVLQCQIPKIPQPPVPSNCPAPPPFDSDFCSRASFIPGCKTTSDCSNGKVCCPGTCNVPQCQNPESFPPLTKPGTCPSLISIGGDCSIQCKYDSDCIGDQKCCSSGCGRQCRSPNDSSKPTCGVNESPKPAPCSCCSEASCDNPYPICCAMYCGNNPLTCQCNPGFVRDSDGQCKKIDQCLKNDQPSCGPNESPKRRRCTCCPEPSCANPNTPCCEAFCIGRDTCQCDDGFVRNDAGLCVKPFQCNSVNSTSRCGPNEVLGRARCSCCPERTCDNRIVPCCRKLCFGPGQCQCKPGFIRRVQGGLCVKEDRC